MSHCAGDEQAVLLATPVPRANAAIAGVAVGFKTVQMHGCTG